MDNLMFSLNATLPVFLVMVIGWALGQKGFLPKQFCTVADKLVFKVTLPVMLFCDMATLDLAHSFDAKFVLFCFAVTAIASKYGHFGVKLVNKRDFGDDRYGYGMICEN